MGLILTGLARCGAWGCFDEFNRLQEATLSAISMLIQPIQYALKDKSDSVQIAEKTVSITGLLFSKIFSENILKRTKKKFTFNADDVLKCGSFCFAYKTNMTLH